MPKLGRRTKGAEADAQEAKESKEPKRPVATGRVTPKSTGRYTPPIPKEYKVSPRWVPVLMLTLLLLGMVIIVSNYLPGAGILPGDTDNKYLLLGLALITGGFVTATRYR